MDSHLNSNLKKARPEATPEEIENVENIIWERFWKHWNMGKRPQMKAKDEEEKKSEEDSDEDYEPSESEDEEEEEKKPQKQKMQKKKKISQIFRSSGRLSLNKKIGRKDRKKPSE